MRGGTHRDDEDHDDARGEAPWIPQVVEAVPAEEDGEGLDGPGVEGRRTHRRADGGREGGRGRVSLKSWQRRRGKSWQRRRGEVASDGGAW